LDSTEKRSTRTSSRRRRGINKEEEEEEEEDDVTNLVGREGLILSNSEGDVEPVTAVRSSRARSRRTDEDELDEIISLASVASRVSNMLSVASSGLKARLSNSVVSFSDIRGTSTPSDTIVSPLRTSERKPSMPASSSRGRRSAGGSEVKGRLTSVEDNVDDMSTTS
jgi:hypothetical protein